MLVTESFSLGKQQLAWAYEKGTHVWLWGQVTALCPTVALKQNRLCLVSTALQHKLQ